MAEALDYDDLFGMFEHYVNDLPEDSISEKTFKAAGMALLGEEALTEFAKGAFRKIHKKGPAGKALVNRMLGAMIAKQVIKRAKAKGPGKPRSGASGFTGQGGQKGTGYKGGDYDKNGGGYGAGTGKGIRVWSTYKKGGNAKATGAKLERKTKAAKSPQKTEYKATMKGEKVKTVIAKAKAKGGAKPGKKAVGEDATPRLSGMAISESVGLAGRVIARTLVPKEKEPKAPEA